MNPVQRPVLCHHDCRRTFWRWQHGFCPWSMCACYEGVTAWTVWGCLRRAQPAPAYARQSGRQSSPPAAACAVRVMFGCIHVSPAGRDALHSEQGTAAASGRLSEGAAGTERYLDGGQHVAHASGAIEAVAGGATGARRGPVHRVSGWTHRQVDAQGSRVDGPTWGFGCCYATGSDFGTTVSVEDVS